MKSNRVSDYQLKLCKACGIARIDHPWARCKKFVARSPEKFAAGK